MEFRILGPLEVWVDGRPSSLGGPKHRSLLAALLVHANEVLSTDDLVNVLWADEPPSRARNAVQVYVSQLRRRLQPEQGQVAHNLLITRPPGYLLRVIPGQLDLHHFEAKMKLARAAMAQDDPARAARYLREALALWRGPALADIASPWLRLTEVPRLEELRAAALEERIDADLRIGRHGELVGEIKALVAAHPFRERLHGQLMLALYRCGRRLEALHVYLDARRVLVDELGLEPGPELQRLEQAILSADPSLDQEIATGSLAARPAGTNLLHHQVPAAIADLADREATLQQVWRLLELPGPERATPPAIVAISDEVATGLTSLALRSSGELHHQFPDGQLYISLRSADGQPLDPADALSELLGALGAEAGSIPEGLEARARMCRALLTNRKVLIVLYNAAESGRVRPLVD